MSVGVVVSFEVVEVEHDEAEMTFEGSGAAQFCFEEHIEVATVGKACKTVGECHGFDLVIEMRFFQTEGDLTGHQFSKCKTREDRRI